MRYAKILEENKENIVPIIQGYEKDPGRDLVIAIELKHISLFVLDEIFKCSLVPGLTRITKKHENLLKEKVGIDIDTKKLDFFIGLYGDTPDGSSIKIGPWFLDRKF